MRQRLTVHCQDLTLLVLSRLDPVGSCWFWYPHFTIKGFDDDFIWMVAIELWRHWVPERDCIELLHDKIGPIFEKINFLFENEASDETLLAEYRRLLDLMRDEFFGSPAESGVCNREFFRTFQEGSFWEVSDILRDAFSYFEDTDPQEALATTDFLFELTEDPVYLDQKAGILFRMGRQAEGFALSEKLASQYPDDFWLQYRLGCLITENGRHEDGLRYFKSAERIASRADSLDSLREQLIVASALRDYYRAQGEKDLCREQNQKVEELERRIKVSASQEQKSQQQAVAEEDRRRQGQVLT